LPNDDPVLLSIPTKLLLRGTGPAGGVSSASAGGAAAAPLAAASDGLPSHRSLSPSLRG